MILHLGGDIIIPMKEIVAILNFEDRDIAKEMDRYIQKDKERKNIEYISSGEPKSCIITKKNGAEKIYFSPISSITLLRRSRRHDAGV